MGGMQGFGPVVREPNEPVFHAPWEGRVMAMRRAVAAVVKLPPALRAAIESLPAADYLRMSYYEIWFAAVTRIWLDHGVVTPEELATGRAAGGPVKASVALKPEEAAALPFRVPPVMLEADRKPRYAAGDSVRARKMNPAGHTRLPRYARARTGVVERVQGVQALPDMQIYGLGDHPQHVYNVRFAARELWGDEASERDSVYLDLWEDYLEPA